ncbi:hypothetical protein BASA61_007858 [Batrachochytrium salamandrivorans]|nr:hypothetical protein BASA60_004618 [Batrachochytrium salamandrivorans]KAH6583740.1 hypothetical protein BASA61_007858 [Batrachochytrium salamandrivorans]
MGFQVILISFNISVLLLFKWDFLGVHGVAQAPIYLIPLGPAPSSMLMPQNLMIPMTPLESLTDAELCAMEGTLRNAIIPAIRNYWTDPGTTCWYCCPIQPNLAYATYRDSCG